MSNARNIASGAKFVDTAGDTMSGNLNVSPSLSADPFTAATFENTNSTAGQSYGGVLLRGDDQAHLRFLTNSTSWNGSGAKQWQIRVGNGQGEDNMHVYSWTKAADVLKINNSGYVTKPYQPAFDVGLTSGAVAATNTVVFNNVRINQGSHYNSSNGRFTAPIGGIYEFYWGGIKNATSVTTRATLYKNGSSVRENRLAEGINYSAACWIMLISLNASDYVEIKITGGDFYGQTDFYGNAFGGRLVG